MQGFPSENLCFLLGDTLPVPSLREALIFNYEESAFSGEMALPRLVERISESE